MPDDLIAIAGGGLIGAGLAAQLAVRGQSVCVCESMPAAAAHVPARCDAVFDELVAAGVLDDPAVQAARARITVTTDITTLAGTSFLIEAVSESLPTKQALYNALERVLPTDAIIASTTSGLLPDRLCEAMAHPERFVVAHFWNPPHLVALVEVVAATATAEAVVIETLNRLAALGFDPVRLHKAVPGFVGNRLQFALLREALHLLDEGVADAETIDLIVKASIGRRYAHIGPLEGADIGGLATFRTIATYLMPQLAKDEAMLHRLDDLVAAGHLGRSSGQGLHTWTAEKEAWLRDVRLTLARSDKGNPRG